MRGKIPVDANSFCLNLFRWEDNPRQVLKAEFWRRPPPLGRLFPQRGIFVDGPFLRRPAETAIRLVRLFLQTSPFSTCSCGPDENRAHRCGRIAGRFRNWQVRCDDCLRIRRTQSPGIHRIPYCRQIVLMFNRWYRQLNCDLIMKTRLQITPKRAPITKRRLK